jgi:hypothetical protein
MTVVAQTPYNAHTANGVTTVFGFTFQVLQAGDLVVQLDGVPQVSGFTIGGIGVQAGGDVTFSVAPANGVLVELLRDIPLTRSTDYPLNGDLPSDVLDQDFDRLWQAQQDAGYRAGLTVGLPAGDTAAPVVLPSVAERANTFLAFDALGKAIAAIGALTVPASAFGASLVSALNAAAARVLLGVREDLIPTGRLLGRTTASTGPAEEITIGAGLTLAAGTLSASVGQTAIAPVTASVAANALTISCGAMTLDFRNTTLGNGAVTTVSGTPANLVISSGSTLGTTNATLSRLAVLALNNAGTIELAVVNLAGAVDISENGVISTTAEGGAGAADSATVVYSTTARTNVPYRILRFIESTQATAGTWATAPSLVAGSAEPLALWLSGYGQVWKQVGGSRALSTNYTNNSGRTIDVAVRGSGSTSGVGVQLLVDGAPISSFQGYNTSALLTVYASVPPGSIYRADPISATFTIQSWAEK